MRLIHCQCGQASTLIDDSLTLHLPPIPSRYDLRPLDDIAAELLPLDETPSLDEIQATPNVPHMAAPQVAPQHPSERLRIIVSGSDAALGTVLTRLMREDNMWAEIAYLPDDPTSPAAIAWGIPTIEQALSAPVTPSPCIRNDYGQVVAGSATITNANPALEFTGEIVVDSQVLLLHDGTEPSATFYGDFGARLVPMADAPGIAATPIVTPVRSNNDPASRVSRRPPESLERLRELPGGRWWTRRAVVPPSQTDASRVLIGRALQAGGEKITITVDGMARPRPVPKVAFYRHLRDIQSVRINDENEDVF